ncbi:MAG: glycoside hydrolase family 5 protein, partial [Defluviitaleaceae bacterium]|nr:glycoside hydrolase family 5 protein [Defluviitaleaceae bacterium]
MKKIFAMFFLIFALAACGDPPEEILGYDPEVPRVGVDAETPEGEAITDSEIASETTSEASLDAPSESVASRERSAMSDISSADFVMSIGPGWNLGNQFDAHYYGGLGFHWLGGGTYAGTSVTELETAWVGGAANVVTREFIETVRDVGFRAIRIPVTWNKVAPGPDYQIREDWMARVFEVVEWAYDTDLHIVLNTHHENSFRLHDEIHGIGLTDDEVEHSIFILSTWWEQIAREFEPFGERLIFAGLNEPRGAQGEWSGGTPETRANLNRLNQAFVDT